MFNRIFPFHLPFIIVLLLVFSLSVFAYNSNEHLLIYKTIASPPQNIEIQSNERVNLFINNNSNNIVVFALPELNIHEQIPPNSTKIIQLKLYYLNDKTFIYELYENGNKIQSATLLVKTGQMPVVFSSIRNIRIYDQKIVIKPSIEEAIPQLAPPTVETTTQSERYIRGYW